MQSYFHHTLPICICKSFWVDGMTYLEDCRDQIGLHIYRIYLTLIGQWCPITDAEYQELNKYQMDTGQNVKTLLSRSYSILKYRKYRSDWLIIEKYLFSFNWWLSSLRNNSCLMPPPPWYPPFFTFSLLFNLLFSLLFKAKAYTFQIYTKMFLKSGICWEYCVLLDKTFSFQHSWAPNKYLL